MQAANQKRRHNIIISDLGALQLGLEQEEQQAPRCAPIRKRTRSFTQSSLQARAGALFNCTRRPQLRPQRLSPTPHAPTQYCTPHSRLTVAPGRVARLSFPSRAETEVISEHTS